MIEGKFAAIMLLSLAAAVALLLAAFPAWAAPEPAGRAGIITGTVSIERAAERRTLKAGDPVFVEDRIITGPESSAEIVFVDENRMKLAANTDLEITDYICDPSEKIRQGLVSLAYGKARFTVRGVHELPDERFRVATRTGLVVSGDSDFIVTYDRERPNDEVCRDGLMAALCLENFVIVMSLEFEGKPAVLTSNMISRVCGPSMPAPPRFATPAESAAIPAGLDRIANTRTTPPEPPENPTDCSTK